MQFDRSGAIADAVFPKSPKQRSARLEASPLPHHLRERDARREVVRHLPALCQPAQDRDLPLIHPRGGPRCIWWKAPRMVLIASHAASLGDRHPHDRRLQRRDSAHGARSHSRLLYHDHGLRDHRGADRDLSMELRQTVLSKERWICAECHDPEGDRDARFCSRCGGRLP